jgi:metal-dependent amidase/aminoacylase/carboxypeptidase family protein
MNGDVSASVFKPRKRSSLKRDPNQLLPHHGRGGYGLHAGKSRRLLFLIGSANDEKKLNYNHHHPKFDFDEQALVNGVALMASAAADLLNIIYYV